MTIEWSNFISVGIDVVDDHNKVLIAIVNRLETAVAEQRGHQHIEEVLCDLAEFFGNHFNREEYLMQRYRFPEAERHREEHRKFEVSLTRLITGYERYPDNTIDQTLFFLRAWLADHVFGADFRLGQFLRSTPVAREVYAGRFRTR